MPMMMSHFSPFPIDTPRLRVQGLGVQERMRPVHFDRPRGWPHLLLVLFHDPVPVRTRNTAAIAPPGSLVCWPAGVPHALGDPLRPWNHSWLSVSGTDVSHALRASRLPTGVPTPFRDPALFDRELADLYAELTRPPSGPDARSPHVLRAAVTALIHRLARAARPAPRTPPVPPALLGVRRHVESHYADPLTLPALADLAGLSVSQFCHLYRRHFGTAPMSFVRSVRLARAAILLRDTPLKIHDIASRTGFPDHHHFSKAFRHHFGTPPSHYRSTAR